MLQQPRFPRASWPGALAAGLAILLAGTEVQGQGAPAPSAKVPWDQIEAGLARGDAKAAREAFRKARKADDSGLADLLSNLTEAYISYHRLLPPKGMRGDAMASQRAHQILAVAYGGFEQRRIPPALLMEAVSRIRPLLAKTPPPAEPPQFLRPLLCHLRLLASDQTNLEGQPIAEPGRGMPGSVGLFTPSPLFTEAAKKAGGSAVLIVELIADAEGCVAWLKVLKSDPPDLQNQTMPTFRWHVYEPARHEGAAVPLRFVLTTGFRIG